MESVRTLRAMEAPRLLVNSKITTGGSAVPAELAAATWQATLADVVAGRPAEVVVATQRYWAYRIPVTAKRVRLQFLMSKGAADATSDTLVCRGGLYGVWPGVGRGDGTPRVGNAPNEGAIVRGHLFTATVSMDRLFAGAAGNRNTSPFTGETLLEADGATPISDNGGAGLPLWVGNTVAVSLSYSAAGPTVDTAPGNDRPSSLFIDPSFFDLLLLSFPTVADSIAHVQCCVDHEVTLP